MEEIVNVKTDLVRLMDLASSILGRVKNLESVVGGGRKRPGATIDLSAVDDDFDDDDDIPAKALKTEGNGWMDDALKNPLIKKEKPRKDGSSMVRSGSVGSQPSPSRKRPPPSTAVRPECNGLGLSSSVLGGTFVVSSPLSKPSAKTTPNSNAASGPNFVYDGDRVVVYTDGSCYNNGKPNAKGGIGVFWNDGCSLNVSEPLPGKQSNNIAELQAAVSALRIAKERNLRKIQLRTDSGYVKMGITNWILTWKKNGWQTASKNPMKNVEDWKELDGIRSEVDVERKWVEAHKGIHGNEMADQLANAGAQRK